MMGPGPNNMPLRVIRALSMPIISHFHQATFEIMDQVKEGLQYMFQTKNPVTLAISASGHGGMEAAFCNLIEPGDKVLILVNGHWGHRAADIAVRYGASLVTLEKPPGSYFEDNEVESAVRLHKPVVLFVTQGESSAGLLQPIQGLGEICQRNGCLLVVDTVASLGGVAFFADKWKVDCVYTGSQKVIGAPPGLAPISFSQRAVEKMKNRKQPLRGYYWDMQLLGQYWNCFPGLPRVYHHTMSTPQLYALREALALIAEEGLENVIERHQKSAKELYNGLEKMGVEFLVQNPAKRLPTITAVKIPRNIDPIKLMHISLNEYDMETAGGLGPTVGKVFRIGVMGVHANSEDVSKYLTILRKVLQKSQL